MKIRCLSLVVASLFMSSLSVHAADKKAKAKDKKAEASAAECAITVEGTDQMQYQQAGKKLESITVPTNCPQHMFTVTLKHVGKLPKQVMGHNFVLTATSDAKAVNDEAVKLGPSKDYLVDMKVEPFKSKVLASATKLLAGGESEDIKIDTSHLKKGADYTFFCTFPGHFTMMQGKLIAK